ncbi:hypothetical protein TWF696_005825 [Orbilia brochopaga]|uniref:NACHT domain-containing protein n=1 Tax=Orbilia brochopaga TaxID=3140254 RepID=A0AAV9UX66_9PEZI
MSHLTKPSFFSRLRSKSRSKSPAPNASPIQSVTTPPGGSGSSNSQTASLPSQPNSNTNPQAGKHANLGPPNPNSPGLAGATPSSNPNQNNSSSVKPHLNIPIGGPAGPAKKPSLWDEALLKLPQEDQDNIKIQGGDKLDVLKSVLTATEDAKTAAYENAWKINWKGEDIVLRDITDKIIVWIKKFKEVGDTIIQYDPGHAALPWAGVRFLLQVTIQDVENCGNVLIGIEKVSKIISRCSAMELLYLNPNAPNTVNQEALKEAFVCLYSGVLRFLAKAKKFFTHSTGGRLRASILQSDFHEKYLDDIDTFETDLLKWTSILDRELLKDTSETRQKEFSLLKSLINGFELPIARIDARLEKIADDLDTSRRSDILEWLSKTDYRSVHESTQKSITEGTCRWLHKDSKFSNWRTSSSSSIFWLRGNPGCGKTRLTASVIRLLLEYRQKNSSQEAIAYFYVDKTREQTGNHDTVASAIAKQLAAVRPDAPIQPPVVTMFKEREKSGRKSEPPSFDEACQLITDLTEIYPQTCIVIDALDEMNNEDGQWELVEFLKKLIDTSSGLIKIFLSSRPNETQLNTLLSDVCKHFITLGDNGADIKQFVQSTLDKLVDSRRLLRGKLPDTTRTQIVETLTTKAEGMFLWVSLQMQELTRLRSNSEVETRLRTIPLGISNLYQDIYEKIFLNGSELDRKVAELTLRWILGAMIPIRPDFLLGWLQLHHQVHDLTTDDILSICRNILTLEKNAIVFTHLTAKEFILSQAGFRSEVCQKDVTLHTLQLLSSMSNSSAPGLYDSIVEEEFKNGVQELGIRKSSLSPHTPRYFALCFWIGQIQVAGDEDADIYRTLSEIMGTQSHPSSLFTKLIQFYSKSYSNDFSEGNIWFTGCGEYNLTGIKKHQALRNFCTSISSNDYTPLEIAIAASFSRYTLWILENEPPSTSFIYETRLLQHSASFYRHDDGKCFKKLLSLAAPENLRLFELYPIFEIFARDNATDIALHMLEYLRISTPKLQLDTELMYAAFLCLALRFDVSRAFILPILSQKPDLQLDRFHNPLLFLISWDMEDPARLDTVKLLLDHGYDINTKLTIGEWWTARNPGLSISTLEAFVVLNNHPRGWRNFFQLLEDNGVGFSKTAAMATKGIRRIDTKQLGTHDMTPRPSYEAPQAQDSFSAGDCNLFELLLRRYLFELDSLISSSHQHSVKRDPSISYYQGGTSGLKLEDVILIVKTAIKCGATVNNAAIMRAAHLDWLGIPAVLQEIKQARPDADTVIEETMDKCRKAVVTKTAEDMEMLSQYILYGGVDIGASPTGKLEDSLIGTTLAKEERLSSREISKAAFQICKLGFDNNVNWFTNEDLFNDLLDTHDQQLREYLLKCGITKGKKRPITTLPWPHIVTKQLIYRDQFQKAIDDYREPGSLAPIDPKISRYVKSRADSLDKFFEILLAETEPEEDL